MSQSITLTTTPWRHDFNDVIYNRHKRFYICTYINVSIDLSLYLCSCVRAWLCVHVPTCMYVCVHGCIHVSMSTCVCVCTFSCVCALMYVCLNVCMLFAESVGVTGSSLNLSLQEEAFWSKIKFKKSIFPLEHTSRINKLASDKESFKPSTCYPNI